MAVQLAVFDFDGTLADSMAQVLAAYNEVAPGLGLSALSADDLARLRKLSVLQSLGELRVPAWKLPALMRAVRNGLHERVHTMDAFPGVAAALAAIRAAGCRTAILSSNSPANIERFCIRHGMEGFEAISGDVGMFGKSRRLRALLARLGVAPTNACYVGDELRDLEAAKAAGTSSIAVSWGYADREALRAASPHYLVDTPDALVAAVLS